ncbi:MAG TPA: MFS transporter, partial [Acidimicrobiia bacterium]|nr:MFS transporter [Acidimicrobiia bacterium]
MTDLDQPTLLRRFLILRVSRWLPTGLLIPVFVLFLVDRGLTLTEIGVVTASQGLGVMLLELPTGGLADAIGRRKVLLGANVFDMIALALILFSHSLLWFVVAFALEGVYRALESGPLEAWYVDGVHVHEPGADVEKGLSRAGVAIGVALG